MEENENIGLSKTDFLPDFLVEHYNTNKKENPNENQNLVLESEEDDVPTESNSVFGDIFNTENQEEEGDLDSFLQDFGLNVPPEENEDKPVYLRGKENYTIDEQKRKQRNQEIIQSVRNIVVPLVNNSDPSNQRYIPYTNPDSLPYYQYVPPNFDADSTDAIQERRQFINEIRNAWYQSELPRFDRWILNRRQYLQNNEQLTSQGTKRSREQVFSDFRRVQQSRNEKEIGFNMGIPNHPLETLTTLTSDDLAERDAKRMKTVFDEERRKFEQGLSKTTPTMENIGGIVPRSTQNMMFEKRNVPEPLPNVNEISNFFDSYETQDELRTKRQKMTLEQQQSNLDNAFGKGAFTAEEFKGIGRDYIESVRNRNIQDSDRFVRENTLFIPPKELKTERELEQATFDLSNVTVSGNTTQTNYTDSLDKFIEYAVNIKLYEMYTAIEESKNNPKFNAVQKKNAKKQILIDMKAFLSNVGRKEITEKEVIESLEELTILLNTPIYRLIVQIQLNTSSKNSDGKLDPRTGSVLSFQSVYKTLKEVVSMSRDMEKRKKIPKFLRENSLMKSVISKVVGNYKEKKQTESNFISDLVSFYEDHQAFVAKYAYHDLQLEFIDITDQLSKQGIEDLSKKFENMREYNRKFSVLMNTWFEFHKMRDNKRFDKTISIASSKTHFDKLRQQLYGTMKREYESERQKLIRSLEQGPKTRLQLENRQQFLLDQLFRQKKRLMGRIANEKEMERIKNFPESEQVNAIESIFNRAIVPKGPSGKMELIPVYGQNQNQKHLQGVFREIVRVQNEIDRIQNDLAVIPPYIQSEWVDPRSQQMVSTKIDPLMFGADRMALDQKLFKLRDQFEFRHKQILDKINEEEEKFLSNTKKVYEEKSWSELVKESEIDDLRRELDQNTTKAIAKLYLDTIEKKRQEIGFQQTPEDLRSLLLQRMRTQFEKDALIQEETSIKEFHESILREKTMYTPETQLQLVREDTENQLKQELHDLYSRKLNIQKTFTPPDEVNMDIRNLLTRYVVTPQEKQKLHEEEEKIKETLNKEFEESVLYVKNEKYNEENEYKKHLQRIMQKEKIRSSEHLKGMIHALARNMKLELYHTARAINVYHYNLTREKDNQVTMYTLYEFYRRFFEFHEKGQVELADALLMIGQQKFSEALNLIGTQRVRKIMRYFVDELQLSGPELVNDLLSRFIHVRVFILSNVYPANHESLLRFTDPKRSDHLYEFKRQWYMLNGQYVLKQKEPEFSKDFKPIGNAKSAKVNKRLNKSFLFNIPSTGERFTARVIDIDRKRDSFTVEDPTGKKYRVSESNFVRREGKVLQVMPRSKETKDKSVLKPGKMYTFRIPGTNKTYDATFLGAKDGGYHIRTGNVTKIVARAAYVPKPGEEDVVEKSTLEIGKVYLFKYPGLFDNEPFQAEVIDAQRGWYLISVEKDGRVTHRLSVTIDNLHKTNETDDVQDITVPESEKTVNIFGEEIEEEDDPGPKSLLLSTANKGEGEDAVDLMFQNQADDNEAEEVSGLEYDDVTGEIVDKEVEAPSNVTLEKLFASESIEDLIYRGHYRPIRRYLLSRKIKLGTLSIPSLQKVIHFISNMKGVKTGNNVIFNAEQKRIVVDAIFSFLFFMSESKMVKVSIYMDYKPERFIQVKNGVKSKRNITIAELYSLFLNYIRFAELIDLPSVSLTLSQKQDGVRLLRFMHILDSQKVKKFSFDPITFFRVILDTHNLITNPEFSGHSILDRYIMMFARYSLELGFTPNSYIKKVLSEQIKNLDEAYVNTKLREYYSRFVNMNVIRRSGKSYVGQVLRDMFVDLSKATKKSGSIENSMVFFRKNMEQEINEYLEKVNLTPKPENMNTVNLPKTVNEVVGARILYEISAPSSYMEYLNSLNYFTDKYKTNIANVMKYFSSVKTRIYSKIANVKNVTKNIVRSFEGKRMKELVPPQGLESIMPSTYQLNVRDRKIPLNRQDVLGVRKKSLQKGVRSGKLQASGFEISTPQDRRVREFNAKQRRRAYIRELHRRKRKGESLEGLREPRVDYFYDTLRGRRLTMIGREIVRQQELRSKTVSESTGRIATSGTTFLSKKKVNKQSSGEYEFFQIAKKEYMSIVSIPETSLVSKNQKMTLAYDYMRKYHEVYLILKESFENEMDVPGTNDRERENLFEFTKFYHFIQKSYERLSGFMEMNGSPDPSDIIKDFNHKQTIEVNKKMYETTLLPYRYMNHTRWSEYLDTILNWVERNREDITSIIKGESENDNFNFVQKVDDAYKSINRIQKALDTYVPTIPQVQSSVKRDEFGNVITKTPLEMWNDRKERIHKHNLMVRRLLENRLERIKKGEMAREDNLEWFIDDKYSEQTNLRPKMSSSIASVFAGKQDTGTDKPVQPEKKKKKKRRIHPPLQFAKEVAQGDFRANGRSKTKKEVYSNRPKEDSMSFELKRSIAKQNQKLDDREAIKLANAKNALRVTRKLAIRSNNLPGVQPGLRQTDPSLHEQLIADISNVDERNALLDKWKNIVDINQTPFEISRALSVQSKPLQREFLTDHGWGLTVGVEDNNVMNRTMGKVNREAIDKAEKDGTTFVRSGTGILWKKRKGLGPSIILKHNYRGMESGAPSLREQYKSFSQGDQQALMGKWGRLVDLSLNPKQIIATLNDEKQTREFLRDHGWEVQDDPDEDFVIDTSGRLVSDVDDAIERIVGGGPSKTLEEKEIDDDFVQEEEGEDI